MEFVREILARLDNEEGLTSDVIVETIKQEFNRKLDELYLKFDTCEYEYNLFDKEYKSWKESGFSLSYKFGGRHTLLRMAAQDDYRNIIETLIKSGVNIDGNLKRTPLHEAVDDGHKEMVEFLLENGADVNAKTESIEKTPLHYAVEKACDASRKDNIDDYKKYVEIIELLIAKGADVNAGDSDENTPLHYASSIDLMKLLLANGANINARNSTYEGGYTRLHMAAKGGAINKVRFLIDNGADVNIRNRRGETPLHEARDQDMVNLLIEKGVEIDAKDNSGYTALHSAACWCDEPKILTLINHGSDPWAKTNEGCIPLDYYIRDYERSINPPEPGYLVKLKQAYDKGLIVSYSTMVLGVVTAITLLATGNIIPNAPHIIGAAAVVTVAALATGRITYEILKPSTKMEEIKQEHVVQEANRTY
ncbi:MAG: ankyrin repeat domain-containing protein [Wolbachia pipientis]